jgi:hypothetical protein
MACWSTVERTWARATGAEPKGWARGAWLIPLALGAACIPPGELDESLRRTPAFATEATLGHAARPREPDEAAVVVVVLDGARWQEVFVGSDPNLSGAPAVPAEALMPRMHAFVAERGAAIGAPGRGAPMSASGPNFVSLPGYTEIFTGRRSHACADNDCAPARSPTVFDQARAAAQQPSDVAVLASWERIERAASAAPGQLVVSTGRALTSHAEALRDDDSTRDWLERGAHADPFPGYGDFRPDRFTGALAVRYLEAKRPTLMFVGLGEPDEYCHRGDYAGYLASLHASDAIVGDLVDALGRMGARGRRTTVLVTADHGRGRDYRFHGREFPESGRVWLVALGGAVEARGFARSLRPHRLADVAPTVRALLDLPADPAPASGAAINELFMAPAAATAEVVP